MWGLYVNHLKKYHVSFKISLSLLLKHALEMVKFGKIFVWIFQPPFFQAL